MVITAQENICFGRILKGPQIVADRDYGKQYGDQHEESDNRQTSVGPGSTLEPSPKADARQGKESPGEIEKCLHSLGPILHESKNGERLCGGETTLACHHFWGN